MLSLALLFAVGLALLTIGADWLVRGASRLAEQLGVSPLAVGLTVVAFGTSAPELVVSGTATLRGQPGLAVGNIMGSTVANVGLIVGLGALIRPIDVHRRVLVRETPLVILVLTIVMLLSLNDAVGRLDGLALVTGFLVYLGFLARWSADEKSAAALGVPLLDGNGEPDTADTPLEDSASDEPGERAGPAGGSFGPAPGSTRRRTWLAILKIGLGLPALLLGAEWLVDSATEIARAFDVPDAVIGATVVAVGTSLPELASTTAAAVRGLGDIAIGNVIGSNVFNLGLVLGATALLRPLVLPPELVVRQVLPALAFCILLIPLALTGKRVDRWEGLLLLGGYAGFIVWTI